MWLSPDGEHLAFIQVAKTGRQAGGERRLMIVNTRSGAARMLTNGEPTPEMEGIGANSVAWTPDSKSLLFNRGGRGKGSITYLAPLDGSGTDPVYPGTTRFHQIRPTAGIALHPDGRRIAYAVEVPVETPINEIWALENLPDARDSRAPSARQ
jgi:sugar lactone lactonase YvrE